MPQHSDAIGKPSSSSRGSLTSLLEDQRRRWSLGQPMLVEAYCDQTPGLATDKESLLDLVFQEFVLRERSGEHPTRDEYLQRFPQVAEELRLQFFLDDELRFSRAGEWRLGAEIEPVPDADAIVSVNREATPSVVNIPGYDILDVLGRGAMAIVYRARDRRLNRTVALKVLHDRHEAGTADVRRFLTEALAAARLQHAQIVQVYEVGDYQGRPYLAFEYLNGGTLAEHLRGRPLPPREAARMMETLARAVQFAHEHGILHRDLKPGNILIQHDEGGRSDDRRTEGPADNSRCPDTISRFSVRSQSPSLMLKIADFGLAKIIDKNAPSAYMPLTATGDILGTAAYMSPEQARGEVQQLTSATDVYSLGAILYELLTGRPPFVASKPFEVISQLLSDEPPRPSLWVRRMPADIQTICLKCLEKDPLRRYASAAELADDLARFLGNTPIVARHTTTLERTWRWCRRHPTAATVFLSVAVLLVSVTLVTSAYSMLLAEQLTLTRSAQEAEREAKTHALHRLRESYVSEADARRTSGRVGQKFAGLQAVEKAYQLLASHDPTAIDGMRSATIGCLALPDLKSEDQWPDDGVAPGVVSMALGKSLYARSMGNGEVVVRKLGSGQLVARFTELPLELRLVLSPDDSMLAMIHDECRVFQLDVSPPRPIFQSPSQGWWSFLPDNRRILGAVKGGTLTLFELRTGEAVRTFGDVVAETPIVFTRDGQAAALIGAGAIRVFDLETGQMRAQLESPAVTPNAYPLAWHPDGNVLAAGLYPTEGVVLWDVSSGTRLQSFRFPTCELRLCFNSFGDLLLLQSLWESQATIWNVHSDRTELALNDGGGAAIRADDKGNFVCLSVNDAASFCRRTIEHPQVYRTLSRPKVQSSAAIIDLAFSPDSRLAAVACQGVIQFYRSSDWRSIGEIVAGPAYLAYEPSGSLLTWNRLGLNKWPGSVIETSLVGASHHTVATVRLGPPNVLVPTALSTAFDISRDGKFIAHGVLGGEGALVWHAGDPIHSVLCGPHRDVRTVSINSERGLLATGSWGDDHVKLWDVNNGKLITTVPAGQYCFLQFSPDGKWLATSAGTKLRFWNVDTWQMISESSTTGMAICFAPDSSVLAVSNSRGQICLIDPATGRSVATLTHPHQTHAAKIAFAPDGRYLATLSRTGREVVHIWDLWALRKELHTRGLDWSHVSASGLDGVDDSELPTGTQSPRGTIVAVHCIPDDRFEQLEAAEQARRATDAAAKNEIGAARAGIERCLELKPRDALTCNTLAWLLATGPISLRNVEQAVQLAQLASTNDPTQATYANTLGVALYRAARYLEAVTALESSLARNTVQDQPFDLFFLSMCQARLGNPVKARESFDRARKLMDEYASTRSLEACNELRQFAGEAELELAVRTGQGQ